MLRNILTFLVSLLICTAAHSQPSAVYSDCADINGCVPNAITASSTATLTNKTIDADGTGNSITNIENADIKAAAAIALNKLAATTASRALVSDGSGFVSASAATATEVGYLSGVTSSIQEQINALGAIPSGWTDAGTNVFVSTTTDQVAIGTTTPNASLLVQNLTTGTSFRVNDDLGDTTPFIITSAGNVGIGSSAPGDALGVNGDVRAEYFKGNGSLLTGIAGTNAGNVNTLSCADNIDTAIIAAAPGDTLELGSCTYNISSAFTTITKNIRIKGQGKRKTILNTGSNVISTLFYSTSDGLQLSNLTITGTRLTTVIQVNLQGGTSSSGINNIFTDVEIDARNTVDKTSGIVLYDTGGTIIGSEIIVGGADWGSIGQSYGVVNDQHSTADVDNYLTIRNTFIDNISTDTVGDTDAIIRGVRFYNYQNNNNPNNMYLIMDNVTVKNRDDASPHNAIECVHIQGERIIAYIYNSSFDGYGSAAVNSQNKLKDFRCDDGAVCHFSNTSLIGGFWQINNGTVIRDGYLFGNGIILD